jgi:Prokaryotic cytochrome b561
MSAGSFVMVLPCLRRWSASAGSYRTEGTRKLRRRSTGRLSYVSNPERGLPADPVPVAAVVHRERLGGLQQPATARLLHRPPLALITGLGMSPAMSTRFKPISRKLTIQTARSLHFLVLVSFLLFIVVHVSLVFTTGLMRNLNHIYAGRNDHSLVSFWIFAPKRGLAARVTGGAV